MYSQHYALPDGLLSTPAENLHQVLGGPALFHLKGRAEPALFISVLMHGNETTGWQAIRRVLSHYQCGGGAHELPRSLTLFIANTAAAARGVRHLPGQPDFNRVWPGTEQPPCEESAMMQSLVDQLAGQGVFASVDVHNNTGLNPHYACVNRLDHRSLHMAAMFCRTVVYFTTPRGLQSQALADLCPAVTLECGLPGETRGIEHAAEFLDASLHLSHHPEHPVVSRDVDLFHTTGVVKLLPGVDFGYGEQARDLRLHEEIEFYNFRELPAGTVFGNCRINSLPLQVHNERGLDVSGEYFAIERGELLTRKPIMPSMLTRNEDIIRQDCFCYLMERYPLGSS